MILIKNAQVVDGTGRSSYSADILLKDDRISAIGTLSTKTADMIIDGLGLYCAPGFIDVNADSDHYLTLFNNPPQKDFLMQGVTSTFGGHCGSSLAPLIYGGLESIRKWSDINQVNVDWHTMAEFLKTLGKLKLGVNFGTLVGHSTIRRALVGEAYRDLTLGELDIIKKLLRDALKEGAFGLSTGLGYVHTRNVPYGELRELAQLVADHRAVYATHLRSEKEGIVSAVEETIKIAQETNAEVIISHFKPIVGFEQEFKKALALLTDPNMHISTYPYDTSVVPIYTLLPQWTQVGNLEAMKAYLSSPDVKIRLVNELKPKETALAGVTVAQVPSLDYLVGKTLEQFAKNREVGIAEAFIQLLLLTNLRAVVFYKNINLPLVIETIMHPHALVSSNGAALPDDPKLLKHERFYNTFPRFLELVMQQKAMPLETAIRKLTIDPAQKFDLKERGIVAQGAIADLTLFSFNPEGKFKLAHVFVNGRQAVKDGKLQDVLAGKVLRRT